MSKVRWLDRTLLQGPYLALCTTEARFRAALKHCGVTEDVPFIKNDHSNATLHWLGRKGGGDLVCIVTIAVTEERTGIEIAGLLVHEAVHVWQQHRRRIGEDSPGDETEAYAIQSISQYLMWEYERQMGYRA